MRALIERELREGEEQQKQQWWQMMDQEMEDGS